MAKQESSPTEDPIIGAGDPSTAAEDQAQTDASAPGAGEVGASPESASPSPEPSPSDFAVPTSTGVPVADILPPVTSIDAGFGVSVDNAGAARLAPVPISAKLADMSHDQLEATIRSYQGSDLADFHDLADDELRVYAALLAAASAVPIPTDRFPKSVGAWLTLYRINKIQAEAYAAAESDDGQE